MTTLRRSKHDEALTAVVRSLARAEAQVETPPHVEAAVLAAWDAARAADDRASRSDRGGTSPGLMRWSAGLALAASVTLIAGISLLRILHDVADVPTLPAHPAGVMAATPSPLPVDLADVDIPVAPRPATVVPPSAPPTFVVVGEPLTADEPVRVVRLRVAASRLAGFGLQPTAAQTSGSVNVELLVGEDGVARAIRMGM